MKADHNVSNDLLYKVKCRSCGKKTDLWFSERWQTSPEDFRAWATEHSTFPIHKQCSCDNGSVMLHDLVSYKLHVVRAEKPE